MTKRNLTKQDADDSALAVLRSALSKQASAGTFESFVAEVTSCIGAVPVVRAKSGFQFGADMGTGGRHLRRLRIECKRYSKETKLDQREIEGEIREALREDPALELWVLMTTQVANEQLRNALRDESAKTGLPILVVDWAPQADGIADLAAACAAYPETVRRYYGDRAAAAAAHLSERSKAGVERLQRDFKSWAIGFESLRAKSLEQLSDVWTKRTESYGVLGHNAAGGQMPNLLNRVRVSTQLGEWWKAGVADLPAAVLGAEGVGKTISTLQWLVANEAQLPIVLLAGAARASTHACAGPAAMTEFLAVLLRELTQVQDDLYWSGRVRYLLNRPASEGPAMLLLLDGLNENPRFPWAMFVQAAQREIFEGKLRLLITARTGYFEGALSQFRGMVARAPQQIAVEAFDTAPGGELDQALMMHHMQRSDLPIELLGVARVPRFFQLVVNTKSNPLLASDPTVYRLLWEYGRNAYAGGPERASAFEHGEWEEWLVKLARKFRDQVQTVSGSAQASHHLSLDELAQSANRPDLDADTIQRRLSEIIDSPYVKRSRSLSRTYVIDAMTASLGLGMALLAELDEVDDDVRRQEVLARWIEPIAGLDQTAEILRAAVTVSVARGAEKSATTKLLLSSWLTAQNRPESHEHDVVALGRSLLPLLLELMWNFRAHGFSSARETIWTALRPLLEMGGQTHQLIVQCAVRWCSAIHVGPPYSVAAPRNEQPLEARTIRERIGIDAPGSYELYGRGIELMHDSDAENIAHELPDLLFGMHLAPFIEILMMAAVTRAISPTRRSWEGFRWLSLLNRIDAAETNTCLEGLIESVKEATPEHGWPATVKDRILAMLWLLKGSESDEDQAYDLLAPLHPGYYEGEYLKDPAHAFYALEFRHVTEALAASDVPLFRRAQRIEAFLASPEWQAPESFVRELRDWAAHFPVDALFTGRGRTAEDVHFEDMQLVLARFAPDAFRLLLLRLLESFRGRTGQARIASAFRVPAYMLLFDVDDAAAIRALREGASGSDVAEADEAYVQHWLLRTEIFKLDNKEQLTRLISAPVGAHAAVSRDVGVLDIEEFIQGHPIGEPRSAEIVLSSLVEHPVRISEKIVAAMLPLLRNGEARVRSLAIQALAACAPLQLGEALAEEGWEWNDDSWNVGEAGAVIPFIQATTGKQFDWLLSKLPPHAVLVAARLRGSHADETRQAALYLSGLLLSDETIPTPPAPLTVQEGERFGTEHIFVKPNVPKDSNEAFSLMLDDERRRELQQQSVVAAQEYLARVRTRGAPLYATTFDAQDLKAAIEHAPEEVDRWLLGLDDRDATLRRRLRKASGLYTALTEALLAVDPRRGAALWRALRDSDIGHQDRYDVDVRISMLFRVPSSAEVDELRQEILSLSISNTDRDLLDLVIAARAAGASDWLNTAIRADELSQEHWRRKRAIVLRGFLDGGDPQKIEWPQGPQRTTWESLRRDADLWARREGLAYLWWVRFVRAQDGMEAFAAWNLFLHCADRRTALWMDEGLKQLRSEGGFGTLKLAYFRIMRDERLRAIRENEAKPHDLSKKLFFSDTPLAWMPSLRAA